MHPILSDVDTLAELPLSLPPRAADPEPRGFPLLASIAPIFGAVVLWGITGSPMMLAFAALGPIMAVAGIFDSKRQQRRSRARAERARAGALVELRERIAERHRDERTAAWRSVAATRQVLDRVEPSRWARQLAPRSVIGSGPVRSTIVIEGVPYDASDVEVLDNAYRLEDAPVLVDLAGGIGIAGAPALARALARAVLVQTVSRAHPGSVRIRVPEIPEWAWAEGVPHACPTGRVELAFVDLCGARSRADSAAADLPRGPALVAVACRVGDLPPGLATTIIVRSAQTAVLQRESGEAVPFVPQLAGIEEATQWVLRTRAAAMHAGVGTSFDSVPDSIELSVLVREHPGAADSHARRSLSAAVGASSSGALELDLVRGGPHALVAGTTGSGKSEFLLAWIVAIANRYRPDRVSFLLVDFKGGAAFEPVRTLPHVSGVVTDLDETEAVRAVESLRAELRRRERVLRDSGARDIAELAVDVELARLVIVIDEFQAMIERFAELGSVVADIAARGRSLGVHLVLASQRPNGVVREHISANCPIRVSLRVMTATDSSAVIGIADAAELPADLPGRAFADAGDGEARLFHSARADAAAVSRALETHSGTRPARRPWLDALPTIITASELAGSVATEPVTETRRADAAPEASDSLVFGLADDPEAQRRERAHWSPRNDGHVLVLGAGRSGRSSALSALAGAFATQDARNRVVWLEHDRGAAWQTLVTLAAASAVDLSSRFPRLLVIDDVDLRFRAWPDEYRHRAMELVEIIAMRAAETDVRLAVAARSIDPLPSSLRTQFGVHLVLHHRTRAEHRQAGGRAELWSASAPAGRGEWRGLATQIVQVAPWSPDAVAVPRMLDLSLERATMIVSRDPASDVLRLNAAGHSATHVTMAPVSVSSTTTGCFVGDADAWAANWAASNVLRSGGDTVVHGGPAELRVVARDRELPPLLGDPARECWIIGASGRAERRRWLEDV